MIAQIPNSPGTVWFRLYPLFPAWYQGRYPISWEFQLHEDIRFHFHYNKSALLIFLPPSFDWPTQHRHSISAKNIPTLTNHLSITIRQRTEPNSFNYSFPILHCAAALLLLQISRSSATLPISELHLGDAAPVLPITGSKPTEQFKLMFQSTSVDLWEKLCPRGVVPPTAILSWPKRFPFRHSKANGSNSKSDEVWNTVWTHAKINGTPAEMTRWLLAGDDSITEWYCWSAPKHGAMRVQRQRLFRRCSRVKLIWFIEAQSDPTNKKKQLSIPSFAAKCASFFGEELHVFIKPGTVRAC